NVILGMMGGGSVLQGMVLIAVMVMAYRLYTQAMRTVREIEQRHIQPLMARVNALTLRLDAILLDVKDVTARVTDRTERVDAAIRHTLDRVDETADRVRTSLSVRVRRLMAIVQTVRSAFDGALRGG